MALDVARIGAICFDVDGTLRDTDDQWTASLARLLQPLRYVFPGWDAQRIARRLIMRLENPGTYMNTLADQLNIDSGMARLYDRIHQLRPGRPAAPQIIPGVQEMLAHLQRRYPLAIVSARGRRTTLEFLDAHELVPFFQAIASGQTCQHTKPFPDPILWAARQMNVAPGECLMVGDTTVDIRAGRAAGAQTVGVLCGFGEEDELRRCGADLILETTSALIGCLKLE